MKNRNIALCALGLAAAFSLGSAGTASAQGRSDTRIPVRKEGPTTTTVTDTVRLPGRVDTVMVRGRTDTVVRTVDRMVHDTVMQMLPLQKLPGTYFGLGAGVAIPYRSWRNSTKDGPMGQVQVGWFPENGSLGLRLDGNMAVLGNRDTECPGCPGTKLYSGSADVVLRFPLDRTSKLNPVFYLLGGAGLDKFSDFHPYRNTDNTIVTAGSNTYVGTGAAVARDVGLRVGNSTKSLFWDYQGGLGFDFNVASAHMYVESKFVTINTSGGNSHYFPTVAGFKFY